MSDRGVDGEVAWYSAAAVQQFYGEGGNGEPGSPEPGKASHLYALIADQAGKNGRDLLRTALAAVAGLAHQNGGAARADLEEAIADELGRDEEFASRLSTAVHVFKALRGPYAERPPRPVGGEDRAPAARESILDASLWLAAAAGSGVLGNAAYDAVKAAFRKHLRGRTEKAGSGTVIDTGQHAAYSADQLTLIAQLAVQARCGELSIAVPHVRDLRRTEMVLGESSTTIELAAAWVHATVVVPADGFGSASDISVTLYTPGDGRGNVI